MRIEDFGSAHVNGKARVAAAVTWEDCDLAGRRVYFDTDPQFADDLHCDPNAFLLAAAIPAIHHGERRVWVEGKLCPQLRNGLITAILQLRTWYGEANHRAVTIEAKEGFEPAPLSQAGRTALFMSGGVDSLDSLCRNRIDFPLDHIGSIRDCLFVHGLDVGAMEDLDANEGHYRTALESLREFGKSAHFTLIPVSTNVQYLGGDYSVFVHESHGAVMASIAHVFSPRIATAIIASSDFLFDLVPWGSHPLLDPNYSSAGLSIRHDGVGRTRPEKVAEIADWGGAIHHLRSCFDPLRPADSLNCGRCEKCMRTMMELLACGKLDACRTFPLDDVSAELLQRSLHASLLERGATAITSLYSGNACYWRELIEPLREIGRHDLVDVIQGKLKKYERYRARSEGRGWRAALKRFDHVWFHGTVRKLYRGLARRRMGTGQGRS
jgi:hypothetical protein